MPKPLHIDEALESAASAKRARRWWFRITDRIPIIGCGGPPLGRSSYEAQLRERSQEACDAAWSSFEHPRLIAVFLSLIQNEFAWPDRKFIPDDRIDVACTGPQRYWDSWLEIELEDAFGVVLTETDYERFGVGSTLGELAHWYLTRIDVSDPRIRALAAFDPDRLPPGVVEFPLRPLPALIEKWLLRFAGACAIGAVGALTAALLFLFLGDDFSFDGWTSWLGGVGAMCCLAVAATLFVRGLVMVFGRDRS